VDCIFCKIAKGEIPKEFEYQDDKVMVFPDIHPAAPVHLLIVPKEHIEDFSSAPDSVFSAINVVIKKIIEKQKLMGRGYRIVVNGGGAQIIQHLHFHLIGQVTQTAKLA